MPTAPLRIVADGVGRRYGAVRALADASIALEPGEIHAIVGENGAGKSTLLALLAGARAPDSGTVSVGGAPLVPATPREALRRGVGLVRQHFSLFDALSVEDNVALGAELTRGFGVLDRPAVRTRLARLAERVGLDLGALGLPAGALAVGARQRLEIVRVLWRDARALLLDEPTAVLTHGEAAALYATLRSLADEGRTVAVVTHKLDEVLAHADRVTVLRRGRVVGSWATGATSAEELTRAIMGDASLPTLLRLEPPSVAPARFTFSASEGGLDLKLEVRPGEIVGVAGVEGNGQRELVRAIAGLEGSSRATVVLDGVALSGGPAERRLAGLTVVHEDRQVDGLVLDATLGDNLVLGDLGRCDEAATIARRIRAFGIVPDDPSVPVRSLSGGNQQKVVVARALDREVGAAVLAQPTRGVDLAAQRAVHAAIVEVARAGAAVVLVSADLGELRALAHRLVVLVRGKVAAELPIDVDDATLGRAMLGLEQVA